MIDLKGKVVAASTLQSRGTFRLTRVCPAFFGTRLASGIYDDLDFVAGVTAFTPMGRIADGSEIKGTAPYLASNASSFTTGLMLGTEGGCMAK